MPAEWDRHEGTWLVWPRNEITWPGSLLSVVEDSFALTIETLLPREKVFLLVRDDAAAEKVLSKLTKRGMKTSNLFIHKAPVEDGWIRDYGPTYLKDKTGKRAAVRWIFNAWGGKYDDLMRDNEIFKGDSALLKGVPVFDPGIVLEGGSIEVNGAGTCMTTEQCLLNPNRNPSLTRADIEEYLRDYLGVSQVLWLKEGIVGDDTDGHIDDIARFVNEDTIIAAYEKNEQAENHPILKENWELLQRQEKPGGGKWNLVKLPMPEPVTDDEGMLPASYANFLIANGVVLLPVFGCSQDKEAAAILKDLFPGREVVPIPSREVVHGLGTLHCLSQQVPCSEGTGTKSVPVPCESDHPTKSCQNS